MGVHEDDEGPQEGGEQHQRAQQRGAGAVLLQVRPFGVPCVEVSAAEPWGPGTLTECGPMQ